MWNLIFFLSLAFFGASLKAEAAVPNVVVTIKPIHSLVVGVIDGVKMPTLLREGDRSPHTQPLTPRNPANSNHPEPHGQRNHHVHGVAAEHGGLPVRHVQNGSDDGVGASFTGFFLAVHPVDCAHLSVFGDDESHVFQPITAIGEVGFWVFHRLSCPFGQGIVRAAFGVLGRQAIGREKRRPIGLRNGVNNWRVLHLQFWGRCRLGFRGLLAGGFGRIGFDYFALSVVVAVPVRVVFVLVHQGRGIWEGLSNGGVHGRACVGRLAVCIAGSEQPNHE